MIEVSAEDMNAKNRLDSIRHADLKVSILNAFYSQRKDGRLYKIDDFLDSDAMKELYPKTKVTKKNQSSVWSEAGHACVKQFEDM